MNIYRKYFSTNKGPLHDEVMRINTQISDTIAKYVELAKELGANSDKISVWGECRLDGFVFDSEPDRDLFKKNKSGCFIPKKNTKFGREFHKKLAKIPTPNLNDALVVIGLGGNRSDSIMYDGKIYWSTLILIPSTNEVFVSKPWYDEDPEVIAQELSKGKNVGNSNIQSVAWEPTEELTEVKKWEMDRAIQAHNDGVKDND